MKCISCKHFEDREFEHYFQEHDGICKRYPPSVYVPSMIINDVFVSAGVMQAPVMLDGGCGEYEQSIN